MNLLERIFVKAIQGEVAVILVPLQNPAPFQKARHPLADHLEQVVKLFDGGRRGVAEGVVAEVVLSIHAIEKQHVKMDVQVQGRAEALDQRDRPGGRLLSGEASLVGQVGGDRPGDDAQHPAHQLRVGGEQETQRAILDRNAG